MTASRYYFYILESLVDPKRFREWLSEDYALFRLVSDLFFIKEGNPNNFIRAAQTIC